MKLIIIKAFNKTEVAERYYKKIGTFTNRDQAKKNFNLLRHPDFSALAQVIDEIYQEQKKMIEKSPKTF